MNIVNKVLIIGGGFSGMAAAIQTRRAGIEVDLIERDPHWCPLGAGISIGGPTLRALEQLGLYDEFVKHGAIGDNVDLYTANGEHLRTLATPPPVGATKASGDGGIMRPVLARIMSQATLDAGVNVELDCTYTNIELHEENVTVTFSNGTEKIYDLVIGADGVHSSLREQFFPEIPEPEYIGQCVWRAVMPRPDFLERPSMWLGDHLKLGLNAVSKTHMYMFITEDRPEKERIDPELWPRICADLIRRFPDPRIAALAEFVFSETSNIDYRPLMNLLVPTPWNRGRLVMIGDTMAATTPHLAAGAGMGIESGIVLGQELANSPDLQTALDNFHARRWERCAMVVNNSAELARIEITGGDKQRHGQLMGQSMAALAQPI